MTRKVITRYAKILHSGQLSPSLKVDASSLESHDLNSFGPHYANFHKHFLQRLVFVGDFGKVLLYPVRIVDSYVIAIKGKSKLFSSNQNIFKYLVKKGIITYSEELRKEFKEYNLLDFGNISKLTGAIVETLDQFVDEDDIATKKVKGISCIYYIPCLHEPKVVIDAFLEASILTPEIIESLRLFKMKEFESCFSPSPEMMNEIFEKLNL